MNVCTICGMKKCFRNTKKDLRKIIVTMIETYDVDLFLVGNDGPFNEMTISLLKKILPSYPRVRYRIYLSHEQPEYKDQENVFVTPGYEEVPKVILRNYRDYWLRERSDYVVKNMGSVEKEHWWETEKIALHVFHRERTASIE